MERPHHAKERIALCPFQRGRAGVLVVFAANVVILCSVLHHAPLLIALYRAMLDSIALYRGYDNHPYEKLSRLSQREKLRGQRVELFGRSVGRFSLLDQQLWMYASRFSRVCRHAPCAWGCQLRGAHEGQHALTELLESSQALRKDQHDSLRPWYRADVVEYGGTLLIGADNRRSAHIRDAL